MSKLIKVDSEYREWVESISSRFRQSRIKASVKVNDESLRFKWSLGRDISLMHLDAKYGSSFYKDLSNDLKELIPGVESFSVTNLKYMKYFYEMYPEIAIETEEDSSALAVRSRQQLVDESDSERNRQQPVDDLGLSIIFLIPWSHNMLIVNKCKGNQERALFYVRKTLENNWSRSVLLNYLDTDLYERQGKAITNFALTLPEEQSDLAQELTKDPYSFDFISIRERYDEKELKDALVDKVEKFLMELGTGFAFIGREVRIEVGETEKFVDLLFYNTRQHCYVVVEVKATKFDSSYAGQLGTYVVAVNHQMKTEHDNQTLGLLVCKDMDKVEAQYALESSSQPLGVSRYELTKLIPEEFKSSMPTIEEIEAEFSDDEGEEA